MQWVRVRVKVTVRFRVSVSCAFSEAFVGIGRVGIGTCTLLAYGPLIKPSPTSNCGQYTANIIPTNHVAD